MIVTGKLLSRTLVLLALLLSATKVHAQLTSAQLDSLSRVSRTHAADTMRVLALTELCYGYRFINQDSALKFARRGIQLGTKINFKVGLAQAYSDAAFVYYDRSNLDTAAMFWERALELRSELNDRAQVASLYMKLGAVSYRKGVYADALAHQLNALRLYEELGIRTGIARALNNTAAVYQNMNELDQALIYYEKAFIIHEQDNEQVEMGMTLINIGNIYFLNKDYPRAKHTFLRALDLLQKDAQPTNKSIVMNNLSELYTIAGNYDSAAWFTEQALKLRRESSDISGIISSLNMMGRIQSKRKNYSAGEKYLQEALALATDKNLLSEQSRVYKTLHELYSDQGEWKKSLDAHIRFAALEDSMLNESTRKEVAALRIEYETEKKEQQIAVQNAELSGKEARIQRDATIMMALAITVALLLVIVILLRNRRRRKAEIERQQNEIALREAYIRATIESQEQERKRFARDLHDGIGQSISALRLCLAEIQRTKDDETKLDILGRTDQLMQEINSEFRSVAFNLMPHTLIQYGLQSALSEMARRLNSMGRQEFSLNVFEFPDRLDELAEISLYRIVQEWTTNILKHSNATRVDIQLTGHEDELIVLIEDDGSGFDAANLHRGTGNGWKNMRSRINLIKGTIDLDTSPGRQGTTFTLRVPRHHIPATDYAKLRPTEERSMLANESASHD